MTSVNTFLINLRSQALVTVNERASCSFCNLWSPLGSKGRIKLCVIYCVTDKFPPYEYTVIQALQTISGYKYSVVWYGLCNTCYTCKINNFTIIYFLQKSQFSIYLLVKEHPMMYCTAGVTKNTAFFCAKRLKE